MKSSKMKNYIAIFCFLLSVFYFLPFTLSAQKLPVEKYIYAGYSIVQKPVLMDSLNVKGKGFEEKNLLQTFVSFDKVFEKVNILIADSGKINFITPKDDYALHYFKFYIFPEQFMKGDLTLKTADMPGVNPVYSSSYAVLPDTRTSFITAPSKRMPFL